MLSLNSLEKNIAEFISSKLVLFGSLALCYVVVLFIFNQLLECQALQLTISLCGIIATRKALQMEEFRKGRKARIANMKKENLKWWNLALMQRQAYECFKLSVMMVMLYV